MKITTGDSLGKFAPISLTIIIESQKELNAIHALFNHSVIADYLSTNVDSEYDVAGEIRSVLVRLNNGYFVKDEECFRDLLDRIHYDELSNNRTG